MRHCPLLLIRALRCQRLTKRLREHGCAAVLITATTKEKGKDEEEDNNEDGDDGGGAEWVLTASRYSITLTHPVHSREVLFQPFNTGQAGVGILVAVLVLDLGSFVVRHPENNHIAGKKPG